MSILIFCARLLDPGPGQRCEYLRFSLRCYDCEAGQIGDGLSCNSCEKGKQPADPTQPKQAACVPCNTAGTYSPYGNCIPCVAGKQPGSGNTTCDDCQPNADSDGTACQCSAGYVAAGPETCADIDECMTSTQQAQLGVCDSSALQPDDCSDYNPVRDMGDSSRAHCACCHRYSQGCTNQIGHFQCEACFTGFAGNGYGPSGCRLPATNAGCDGVPLALGGLTLDACGNCGGDGSTCTDCAGVPNGLAKVDRCNNCTVPEWACTRDCLGKYGGTEKNDLCGESRSGADNPA